MKLMFFLSGHMIDETFLQFELLLPADCKLSIPTPLLFTQIVLGNVTANGIVAQHTVDILWFIICPFTQHMIVVRN
jgi:hypothetical protein